MLVRGFEFFLESFTREDGITFFLSASITIDLLIFFLNCSSLLGSNSKGTQKANGKT
jgi:hypothetical protein